jgi:hypothetical protein
VRSERLRVEFDFGFVLLPGARRECFSLVVAVSRVTVLSGHGTIGASVLDFVSGSGILREPSSQGSAELCPPSHL